MLYFSGKFAGYDYKINKIMNDIKKILNKVMRELNLGGGRENGGNKTIINIIGTLGPENHFCH
jgi:hypothetical protein